MDRRLCEALHVDSREVEAAFPGRTGIYFRYLKRFPEDGTFADLCEAVLCGDLPCIQRSAHALKGLCATLQLKRLRDLAEEIDFLARQGSIDEIEDRMPELTKEYSSVILNIARTT